MHISVALMDYEAIPALRPKGGVSECPTIDYITHNSLITLTFLSTFHSLGIGHRKVINKVTHFSL